MPIDSQHPEYAAMIANWRKARDAAEGEDAVKAAGATYLPKLAEQSVESYNAYRTRAMFFGATGRTIESFVGLIMRKSPNVEVPAQMERILDSVDGEQTGIHEFIRQVLAEVFTTGRLGLLVDRPPLEAGGGDPYLAKYLAENITNWIQTDGQTRVVLREQYIEPATNDDIYEQATKTQFRELIFDGSQYWQVVHRPQAKTRVYTETEVHPTAGGKPLSFLPFQVINARHVGLAVCKPPLIDLVNVNLSHYRNSADLEHGRHFTGLPTPVITGHRTDDPIYIGSERALILPDPGSSAFYMEFSGAGLAELRMAMEEKQKQMAALGARAIEGQRNGIEAAETARIHQSGEVSLAVSVIMAVETGITNALKAIARWEGLPEDGVKVQINKDLVDAKISSQDLTALVSARQAGDLSLESFLWNLKAGEVLPPDRSIDDEKELIAQEKEKTALEDMASAGAADKITLFPSQG